MTDLEPSFSMRLVAPFLEYLREHAAVAPTVLAAFERDLDARIPIRLALEWLRLAVRSTGDPDIGLRAAMSASYDHAAVVHYAVATSATTGEGLRVVVRYVRLLNDAADFRLETRGDRAILHLGSRVPLSRAAVDFQVASMVGALRVSGVELPADTVLQFQHPSPRDVTVYRQLAGPAELRFRDQFTGIIFDRRMLDERLPGHDPRLHEVLRRDAEQQLSGLVAADDVSARVRALIRERLASGEVSSTRIASELFISRRTLLRRLDAEGTTFRALLEDSRRRLAREHLRGSRLAVQDIALLLGYADTTSFSRAFRRWERMSPVEFRARCRLDAASRVSATSVSGTPTSAAPC